MMYCCLLVAAILLPCCVEAQWLNYSPSGTPMKNGQPDLTAAVPRSLDGKPDLTGVWAHEKTSAAEFKRILGPAYERESRSALLGMELEVVHKYGLNVFADMKPGESLLTPAGEAAMKKRASEQRVDNVCHGEYGWPVAGLLAEPFKFVQSPKETVLLYEVDGLHRQIFADGREFPPEFEFPAYLGYSIGRWDGDTFVVETRGFNDRTPIDGMGHPRSEAMHVTERYHRRDFGHLDTELTFDDPTLYKRPFSVKISYNLIPNFDIFEMFCTQNEKDRAHMVK
ncbi:MAG TPA: hypothetical protein VFW44_06890 [Bryobacteraceae bacterium]|nr:hypothetical protein [Bryobacteraceae bacterium]